MKRFGGRGIEFETKTFIWLVRMVRVCVRKSVAELSESVGSSKTGRRGLGKLSHGQGKILKVFACQFLDMHYYNTNHDMQQFR